MNSSVLELQHKFSTFQIKKEVLSWRPQHLSNRKFKVDYLFTKVFSLGVETWFTPEVHIKVFKDKENFSQLQTTANTNYLFAQLLPAAVLWREIYIYIQVCILVITTITAIKPFVWRLSISKEVKHEEI